MLERLGFRTEARDCVNLTDRVRTCLRTSGLQDGLCTVFSPHTTAGLTLTSFWDPRGLEDLQDEMNRLVPTRVDFKHQHDTPQDAAGHVKAALMGVSLSLIVTGGELLLGHSQGIYFVEFDGPRTRECVVHLMRDPDG